MYRPHHKHAIHHSPTTSPCFSLTISSSESTLAQQNQCKKISKPWWWASANLRSCCWQNKLAPCQPILYHLDSSTSSRLDSNFVNDEQYWKFSTLFQWNPLALHRQRTNSMPSSWTTRSAPTSGITISSVPISKKKKRKKEKEREVIVVFMIKTWSCQGHTLNKLFMGPPQLL